MPHLKHFPRDHDYFFICCTFYSCIKWHTLTKKDADSTSTAVKMILYWYKYFLSVISAVTMVSSCMGASLKGRFSQITKRHIFSLTSSCINSVLFLCVEVLRYLTLCSHLGTMEVKGILFVLLTASKNDITEKGNLSFRTLLTLDNQ